MKLGAPAYGMGAVVIALVLLCWPHGPTPQPAAIDLHQPAVVVNYPQPVVPPPAPVIEPVTADPAEPAPAPADQCTTTDTSGSTTVKSQAGKPDTVTVKSGQSTVSCKPASSTASQKQGGGHKIMDTLIIARMLRRHH